MELKFNLHDKVKLPEAIYKDLFGIVTSIWITDKSTKYEVRYFYECKAIECYFYEWELEKVD